jgi:hypothetical protein
MQHTTHTTRSESYRNRLAERIHALTIKATLGTRRAAGYLRNRGWSLEGSVAFLARA